MEISRFDAGAESVHAEEVDVAALVRGGGAGARLGRPRAARRRRPASDQRPAAARADRGQPRRQRARARRLVGLGADRRERDRGRRRRAGDPATSTCRTSSSASTRRTPPAAAAAPASAWRSRGRTRSCSAASSRSRASLDRARASRSGCSETVTPPSQGRCSAGRGWRCQWKRQKEPQCPACSSSSPRSRCCSRPPLRPGPPQPRCASASRAPVCRRTATPTPSASARTAGSS